MKTQEMLRWRMKTNTPAGPVQLTFDGVEPLIILVDGNGYFETEGQTKFPLYAVAARVYD